MQIPVAQINPGSGRFSGARVYSTAGQTILNNTVTPVAFEKERYDTDNYHDTVTNNTRFTAPTSGYYSIGSAMGFSGSAAYVRVFLGFLVNGVTEIYRMDYAPSSGFASVGGETQFFLNAGDYVETTIFQGSGGSHNLDTAQDYSAEFWISKLPPATPAAASTYLGYTSIGASTEVMTQYRVYMKKITPVSDCLLLSVGAYVTTGAGDHVGDLSAAVLSDSGGAPLRVLGYLVNPITTLLVESATNTPVPRWVDIAISQKLTGGTSYWIAVMTPSVAANTLTLAYDAGSDQIYTSGGQWFADAGFYTVTNSSRAYSMRALIL